MLDNMILNKMNWYKTAKINYMFHLAELRGEWWIMDGSAIFADGDIGDMNHEAYVIQHVQGSYVDDEFNQGEYVDWDGFEKALLQEALEELAAQEERENIENIDEEELVTAKLTERGMSDEEISIARGNHRDAREYGIRHLGWKRVKGNNVETQFLSSEDVRSLKSGLGEILESTEWDDEADTEFNIEVRSTNTMFYDVPYSVIESNNPESILQYRHQYAKNKINIKTAQYSGMWKAWITGSGEVIDATHTDHGNCVWDHFAQFGITVDEMRMSDKPYTLAFKNGAVRVSRENDSIAIEGKREQISRFAEILHRMAKQFGVRMIRCDFWKSANGLSTYRGTLENLYNL